MTTQKTGGGVRVGGGKHRATDTGLCPTQSISDTSFVGLNSRVFSAESLKQWTPDSESDYNSPIMEDSNKHSFDSWLEAEVLKISDHFSRHGLSCEDALKTLTDKARKAFSANLPMPETNPAKKSPALLPESAPILWIEGKLEGETPVDFIKRIYGEHITNGMTQADLRHLDFKLYRSFHNYCNYNNISPESVIPPSFKKINVDEVAKKHGIDIQDSQNPFSNQDEIEKVKLYKALEWRKWRDRQRPSAS